MTAKTAGNYVKCSKIIMLPSANAVTNGVGLRVLLYVNSTELSSYLYCLRVRNNAKGYKLYVHCTSSNGSRC